ncbi:MAG: DUF5119 domain-containing protein [Muribaculaceae bacterium]|nr:DUF5119 domain-containing protein [Muribaculaceae bacterium]
MKRLKAKFGMIVLAGLLSAGVSSCNHKDLDVLGEQTEIEIVYDWRYAPDASPASMAAYLYSDQLDEALRYIFSGRDGGPTHIPAGLYGGLGMNSDETDWAQYRNRDDIESFEIYTHEAESLSAYGISTRAIPRADGAEDEKVVETPGMVWADRQDEIEVYPKAGRTVITFYPQEAVCHYTVDVLDVKNIDNMPSGSIDGTLSGMSEGFVYGKRNASDTKVTLPFELRKAEDGVNSLHGEFLTFGESPVTQNAHKLVIYYVLTDGTKHYATFDVTDQVTKAPDPRHVHIVVRGLDFPSPVATGPGFVPDVDEWVAVNINLKM